MRDERAVPTPPPFNLEAHRRAHMIGIPGPPTNSTLIFDTIDGHGRHRIRAYIRSDEMAHAKSYVGNLQISKDGGTTALTPYRRHEVKAKDDDANTTVEIPMGLVRKGWKVRYRERVVVADLLGMWAPGTSLVEADALKGWSDWFDPDDTEQPPPVTNLTLDIDEHRSHLRYLIPDDPLNADADDPRIAHLWIELWKDALDSGTLIARDRHHRGEHWSCKISKPHNDTFYARVYTVSAPGVKSTAATTSATKNTPSQPAAPAVSFDAKGTRHARYRAIVTVATVGDTDRAIHKYRVKLVHKETHATPTGGDKRKFGQVPGDATGDELDAIFKNIPKHHYVYAATQAVDTQGKQSEWSPWTDAGKPTGSGSAPAGVSGLAKYTGIPRRIKWTWDDPNDDITTRWQVTIKHGGSIVEGPTFVRQARYVYRVPEATKGSAHTAEIVPFDDIGTSGDTASLDGTDDGTVGGDILAPGTVDITPFASTIRPVCIVGSLPALPNTSYPVGSCVVLTTDGKLYRNVSESWTRTSPTTDLTGTITSGQIAANAIVAGKIAADAVTAGCIAAGAISAGQIVAGTISAWIIGACRFYTGSTGSYITIDGVADKDKIKFTSGGNTTSIVATGGGVQIAAGSGATALVAFFGAAPISRPDVTGVKSGGTALTSLINKLANLGLIKDSTT